MSKASQIIVLCEDRAHEVFVKRFLKTGWKPKPRSIRVPPYPNGDGSGKKYVQDNVAAQVRVCRSRQASTVLIIVIDADEKRVASIRDSFDKEMNGRGEKEQIAYIIPKWHIQTWLAYLDGEEGVDETDKAKYKNAYGTKSRRGTRAVHQLADDFAKTCRNHDALQSPPESLAMACTKFERIRPALS
ncbi:MAG: hypothetical protein HQ567_35225 [Candidatus Nealsonbacteria bacterium]|nr:hypothetical protein [Candidatus Nealsonbacteria bacterium]